MLIRWYRQWQCYIWGHMVEVNLGMYRNDAGLWTRKRCLYCDEAWLEPWPTINTNNLPKD